MIRRRRGLPAGTDADFSQIQPDPSQIGGVAQAPFVRLPDPTSLFAARAERLTGLSSDHPMAPYLRFLADVVAAQAAAAALPVTGQIQPDLLALRASHAMPLLTRDEVAGHADLARVLDCLLEHLDPTHSPQAARRAADTVRAMLASQRLDLAAEIFAGAYPADLVGECLFVVAGLQVHLTRLASRLVASEVTPVAASVCPVCGGAPVSSLVVGWTQASKARYCACSLCSTLWNHVRIKCTSCGATSSIAYQTIEGSPGTVAIETCETCYNYIKHMQQHEDPALDPIADDIASYALDVLAREEGYIRTCLNPLFLTS